MTSDSWRHHIFGAAKSPSKIRLKLTLRDGPIVIPPEGGTYQAWLTGRALTGRALTGRALVRGRGR